MRIAMNTRSRWWLLVVVCSTLSSNTFGIPEFVPIQERAQGYSLAGATTLNDSIYVNPAGSAFIQVYSVEGTYNLPKDLAVSILDTKTSGVGGGLGYFRQNVGFSDSLQGFKLALSTKVSETLGVGLGGKIMWGPDTAGNNSKLNDVDLGFLTNLNFIQLGLVVRNLLGGNAGYDQFRELSLGAHFAAYQDIFFLNAAISSKWGNWKPYSYGVGAEYISPYYFSLKGGYRIQPDNGISYWSAGASLLAPKLYVHYAVEFPSIANASLVHTLAMGFNF
jgi:hypothetical protein